MEMTSLEIDKTGAADNRSLFDAPCRSHRPGSWDLEIFEVLR